MKSKLIAAKAFCKQEGIPYTDDEPLASHCTFRIGGNAALFAKPETEEQISRLVAYALKEDIPLLTLGKGSNILFSDDGFSGIVLHLGENFAKITMLDDTTIYAQSGATLVDLCRFAQKHSLTGMEPLFGIPGSVGGAIYMNAGAYGGEVSQVLESTTHVAFDGTIGGLAKEELALGYRHSAYSDNKGIITGGAFTLTPGIKEEILKQMNDYMQRRRDRQPLEYPSAGSTFKRPPGNYASALIDQCGLKGLRIGGAEVSKKHAGFVINVGSATAADVLALIEEIRRVVQEKTGYVIEPEIRLLEKDGTFRELG